MIIHVDPESGLAPYEQIRQQVADMIDSGTVVAGSQLPSIRQLAGDLGLAPGTVARAYRELEQHGYLISRVGRGTTAAKRPTLDRAAREQRLHQAAEEFARTAGHLGFDAQQTVDALRRHLHPRPS